LTCQAALSANPVLSRRRGYPRAVQRTLTLETVPLGSLGWMRGMAKWLRCRDRGRPEPAGQLLPRASAHEPSPVQRLVLFRAEVRRRSRVGRDLVTRDYQLGATPGRRAWR